MSNIIFGNPHDIKEGTWYPDRAALIEADLHRHKIAGIDGNGKEGVSSIVVSGGYEDDVDLGDEIIYTGHGGNDPATQKQIAHQSWQSSGNQGLVVSKKRNLSVRVIRGYKNDSVFAPNSGYVYAGLFNVEDYWDKMGKSGFKICQFKLIKINSQIDSETSITEGTMVKLEPKGKEPKWFSIGVDAPNAQKLNTESKMAQLLSDKKKGEMIDFGSRFKVLEVRKYLSH